MTTKINRLTFITETELLINIGKKKSFLFGNTKNFIIFAVLNNN
jgi:hypothetical protein